MKRLPALFVSHGSPMHALEPGAAGEAWKRLARELPRPEAIVIASAHWETRLPMLTGSSRPETVHDFYNFPEPLYALEYPAPGAPAVAARAKGLIEQAGLGAALDGERGLDHGAWAPLLHAYPAADVPVVELSVQTALGAGHHLAVGRALGPLADEGILLIGSGHMTHNLRDRVPGAPPAGYVREFQRWVDERIVERDHEALAAYRARAPHARRAHPTEEHFMPLFVALGAAGAEATPERVFDVIEDGALAMDAYLFRPAAA
jgi:4,5-DOPA dioxygenase extradiol